MWENRKVKTAGVLSIVGGCLAVASQFAPVPLAANSGVYYRDSFEGKRLNQKFWSLRRMGKKRFWFDVHTKSHGKQSLAIRVKGTDTSKACSCQQNEIRERRSRRLDFGTEAWYAFSMRIEGKPGVGVSQRWVVGGWKQETDGSAFVAQRFDHGVFHITLESGDTRVLLATSTTPVEGFIDLLKKGILGQFSFVAEPKRYRGKTDLKFSFGHHPVLPNPSEGWVDLMYRIKGGLDGKGIVEVYANGNFIARAAGTIGVKKSGGPTQYFKMGHNRAPLTDVATVYLDNFRRGGSRADVERE